MQTVGLVLIFIGFVLVTATVRLQAFKESTRTGLFTFVIPFYCWWYGFARYRGPRKSLLMFVVLGLYLVGGGISVGGMVVELNRSKDRFVEAEAREHLSRICGLASEAFNSPHVDQTGQRMFRFPESSGPTPSEGTCCAEQGGPDSDGDRKCDPDPRRWSTPGWSALRFAINEPHACAYSFVSSGENEGASFAAEARCDPDCDGRAIVIRQSVEVGPGPEARPIPIFDIRQE